MSTAVADVGPAPGQGSSDLRRITEKEGDKEKRKESIRASDGTPLVGLCPLYSLQSVQLSIHGHCGSWPECRPSLCYLPDKLQASGGPAYALPCTKKALLSAFEEFPIFLGRKKSHKGTTGALINWNIHERGQCLPH